MSFIDQDILVIGRVVWCLAVVGVHRPDQFFDAVAGAEHAVHHVLKHGSFGLVDTDEHRAVLGEQGMKRTNAVFIIVANDECR